MNWTARKIATRNTAGPLPHPLVGQLAVRAAVNGVRRVRANHGPPMEAVADDRQVVIIGAMDPVLLPVVVRMIALRHTTFGCRQVTATVLEVTDPHGLKRHPMHQSETPAFPHVLLALLIVTAQNLPGHVSAVAQTSIHTYLHTILAIVAHQMGIGEWRIEGRGYQTKAGDV